jgi:hypothetical protein
MKKIVFVFGLIAGLIVTTMMVYTAALLYRDSHLEGNAVLGYTTMLVAFSMVFVGIKRFRDKYNQGVISFGKAFKTGLYITLVASTMYVVVWLVDYYVFMPDFMEKYTSCVMNDARNSGASQAELNEKAATMANYTELYKNPLMVVLMTYAEIFPVGLVLTLISALLLKRKAPQVQPV